MEMDGCNIVVGDSVHDIVFGHGIIERLVPEQDKFWVRFGTGLRCFDTGGFGNFKERTLYWRNPIIVIPHKDTKKWDLSVEISQAVSNVIGRN